MEGVDVGGIASQRCRLGAEWPSCAERRGPANAGARAGRLQSLHHEPRIASTVPAVIMRRSCCGDLSVMHQGKAFTFGGLVSTPQTSNCGRGCRDPAQAKSLRRPRPSGRARRSARHETAVARCRVARNVRNRCRPEGQRRQLRDALGDDAESPRFIETAHGVATVSSDASRTNSRRSTARGAAPPTPGVRPRAGQPFWGAT